MTGTEGTAPRPTSVGSWERTKLAVLGLNAVLRWLACGVLISAVPVAVALAALPSGTAFTDQLGHGDMTVLASGIAGGSLSEFFGAEPPRPKWVFGSGLALTLLGSTILLMGAAERDAKFTPDVVTNVSWWLLVLSIVFSLPLMAPEIRRIRLRRHSLADPGGTQTTAHEEDV